MTILSQFLWVFAAVLVGVGAAVASAQAILALVFHCMAKLR